MLFAQDPERAHERVMGWLARVDASQAMRGRLAARYAVRSPALEQELWGLRFPAPLGLAAGLDKNAHAPLAWQALGFGFAELGTVTPKPQPGNPKPRLWRDPRRKALVNRMGFNNDGASAVARRIAAAKPRSQIPLGLNIGKQRETPTEAAPQDYLACLDAAGPADFVVVNVSSPNTPGLRALQEPAKLRALLLPLAERARAMGKPLLVKFDPDMEARDLEAAVGVAMDARVDGIVATNTSASLPRPAWAGEGGLSGLPLKERSNQVLRRIALLTQGEVPLVGVGGVFTEEDAYAKIQAGASLVEAYTGFIYEGPSCAKRVHRGLLELLRRDGHSHLRDAIGTGLKESS